MSLYRKAKPGELARNVTHNATISNPVNAVTPVVTVAKTNAERQAAWRAREKVKRVAQSSPPPDLKGIWLLVAELG